MRVTTDHYAAAFLGLAAVLALGCGDSTAPTIGGAPGGPPAGGPTTGAIKVVVETGGASSDVDPDGYTMSIDGGPDQALAILASVTIVDLSVGNHLVRLGGLAPNCSVGGTNPRSVDVLANAAAPSPVSFVVSCIATPLGSIQVSTATSGPDPDPDGYSVTFAGVLAGHLPPNGTLTIAGIRQGQVLVALSAVSPNCVVDGSNPRMVNVTSGPAVDVAFVIRCVSPGALQVTTATTGVHLDPNGYDLEIRLQGSSSGAHTAVSTNGTAAVSGLLPGTYLLTLFDVAPNCEVVPSPRVVTVASGSATPVTLDVTCVAPGEFAYASIASIGGASPEIYIFSSDGNGAYPITTQPGSDVDPAWSPDGSRIAFTSERDGNREIYVMNANGANPVRLTNMIGSDYRPAWSPDGARIAFVSTRDGNPEIYVMSADGTNPVRLTTYSGYDADPAWSPDGRRIAFSSDRNGSGGIWVMNADGSGLTRLTSNIGGDLQPAWSPDGTRIAFSRVSTGNSDIFILNADGSGLEQLTHGIDNAADPSWSPNGRKIVLGSTPSSCDPWWFDPCDPYIVVVSSADGASSSLLTTFAMNPAWRP